MDNKSKSEKIALFSAIQSHLLITYFILAYAFSWTMVALIPVSFVFALLALFGPTLAAILVTGYEGGRSGVSKLLRRVVLRQVGIAWYAVAICLPLLVTVAALGVQTLVAGTPFNPSTGTPIGLMAFLAILVVGESLA
jgi:hypothetical protein